MSNVPADLKYTKSHEWVKDNGDGTVTVGITDHAQELLGDMVFVEVPEAGRSVSAGEDCAVVESVKAAETVNSDAYGEGWMFKVRLSDAGELGGLMDAAAYEELVASEA